MTSYRTDISSDDHVDKSHWLPDGEPLITPERAAKGDVLTGNPCTACDMTGRDQNRGVCRECSGKGRVGIRNAAGSDLSEIRFAQIHEVNLLNCLWNCRHISDQQHHDGQTFQIWRDMHRVQLGVQRPVSSGGEEVFGVRLRAYGYILIIQRMNRYDLTALETSFIPMTISWAEWIARNRIERYIIALDRLSRLLPPIKDQIAYLEGLPDEEREELSKCNMKKYLDGLLKEV